MKNLPLGVNTIASIKSQNMVYVDKTHIAWELIKHAGRFFLSRPRRFGKSLFIDTLKEIFEGNSELFNDLYIYDKWDWSQKYPVIKIDFSDGALQNRKDLDKRIYEILHDNADNLQVKLNTTRDIPGTFGELIRFAQKKHGKKTVVLVDEYDKPILDNIENSAITADMREGLKNLYSVLKGQDAHLQFVFMTGVTKFSKVTLFSGVNQLTDITLNENFSTICGYTHKDLNNQFSEHLKSVDLKKLMHWYNGYKWLGNTPVYNPYDILLFIHNKMAYRNYWFETGNPTFLVKLFQKNRYFLPTLENLVVTEEIIDSFDVERINPLTLLFQSGYLTVKKTFTRRQRMMFQLEIPNFEVKIALHDHFINAYTDLVNEKIGLQDNLYDCLEQGDVQGMVHVIKRLFSSIPWRNFTHNDLADYEGYYASVLYAFFSSLDAEIIPEDITNHGQVDMTVKSGKHIYVMEIKVVEQENMDVNKTENMEFAGKSKETKHNPALKQIQERGYAEKYRGIKGVAVHEVGLVFSKKLRNLTQNHHLSYLDL
ncbi:conserved hypothetical protein [Desulfamplus magnetovallimortis]|uniref:AAA-ATPase-like domain-containing protein n=1 Tax=Desulfamplus magnetovallimortis TaxID=1246637 RepID=A0A1W1HFD6_9BACT|nr:ATP-binding protein [Desulfamplus magnetovallimortis]SLM31180.1 conserved hypothetical protein [Desulfamplus magnetovallimortis]